MKKSTKKLTAWLNEGELSNPPAAYRTAWAKAIREFKLKGRAGETTLVLDGPAPSLILGIKAEDQSRAVFEAAIRAIDVAKKHKFDEVELGGVPRAAMAAALRGLAAGQYRFKITAKASPEKAVRTSVIGIAPSLEKETSILADSIRFARDLVNMPPDQKHPALISKRVLDRLKKIPSVRIETWDEKRLKKERCNGILAVGIGSGHTPRIMILRYTPKNPKKEIALVGKGVTFDSGGLNVKTYEGMKTMKCDMAGSAAVIGAFESIARRKLGVKVTAYVGFTENMLGPFAFKPGNVVTMRSGKTVEILNTDAEGRIVLGDLLDLAEKSSADTIIDLATLTGACLVALGEETAGVFSTDDALAKKILDAGESVGESLWRLPLGRDYRDKIKAEIADIKNVGGRHGGSSTAAQFLAEFVGRKKWAHLDIAGPAYREGGSSGRPGGATGFGAATLVELITKL